MLYAGVALGFLGALLGLAISVAALLGAALGRLTGDALSMGAAGMAIVISLAALAGAIHMRGHWRAGALLDALCGGLGMLALPEYYLAPALTLLMPALIYVAADVIARRRAARQVARAAIKARQDIAGQCGADTPTAAAKDMTDSAYDDELPEVAARVSGRECDAGNDSHEAATHAVEPDGRGRQNEAEPSEGESDNAGHDALPDSKPPAGDDDRNRRTLPAIEADESGHAEADGLSPTKHAGGISRGTRGRQNRGR